MVLDGIVEMPRFGQMVPPADVLLNREVGVPPDYLYVSSVRSLLALTDSRE